jgi:hypothetical protein
MDFIKTISASEWISLTMSLLALFISIRLGWLAHYQHKTLLNAGKSAFHSYIMTYFILNSHRTEFEGSSFKVSQETNNKQLYISEIKNLAERIDNLKTEPFYYKLYSKYSEIAFLPNFLRQEIKFLESKPEYGYDHDVWRKMYKAFTEINKELDHDRSELEKTIYDYAKALNKHLLSNNNITKVQ